MLNLLCSLVKYGYYASLDDINELIHPLVSLLDGKNDKPHPDANSEASSLFREATMVVYTCIHIIIILQI